MSKDLRCADCVHLEHHSCVHSSLPKRRSITILTVEGFLVLSDGNTKSLIPKWCPLLHEAKDLVKELFGI